MKRIITLSVLAFMFMGCASSTVIKEPIKSSTEAEQAKYVIKNIKNKSKKVAPEHFLHSIEGYLKAELKKRGIAAEDEAQINREVDIEITYYRMRSKFSRVMIGAMAGKDEVTSKVTILDSKTGKVLGASEVDTYNVTAVADEQDVAKMHAKEIANFLSTNPK